MENCILKPLAAPFNRARALFAAAAAAFLMPCMHGAEAEVSGPDAKLKAAVWLDEGRPFYSLTYGGRTMLEKSPLGFDSDMGDFSSGLVFKGAKTSEIDETYTLDRIKRSKVRHRANELTCTFANADGRLMDVVLRAGDNDLGLCYAIPRPEDRACIRIKSEATGFDFPEGTTTFLSSQMAPMTGWKRTAPSYETPYWTDRPLGTPSANGAGFVFPALFRVGGGWALVGETGVGGGYCGSRLGEGGRDGLFKIEFPLPSENNSNGTAEPAMALPARTPWRTVTVGDTLKPIVETTVAWDLVRPRFSSAHSYRPGRSTWSWILWQDSSINFKDQVKFIDLASEMGYEYVLIDNYWDRNIGRERMEELAGYAAKKNVGLFLWYSSSGWWNDITQSPTGIMSDPVERKREMRWLGKIGVKGIKVDFFGGDKQETMRLYEAILSDADDFGLMVDFHGCTMPRGWERMYPNYVGSEAVVASEALVFGQWACDEMSRFAALHPFIRNSLGSMEFGGGFMNRRLNRGNDGGSVRRTTDAFELAVPILFQSPFQAVAIAPNNLSDAPKICMDFLKGIPTLWDDTQFVAGYPGKYAVIARRHGEKWYVAAVNAGRETLEITVRLPMLAGKAAAVFRDGKDGECERAEIRVPQSGEVRLRMLPDGGAVITGQADA